MASRTQDFVSRLCVYVVIAGSMALASCMSGPSATGLGAEASGGISLTPDAEWIAERSIAELETELRSGRRTSEQLVQIYLSRIQAIDRSGPMLRSIIALNPDALAQARALDAERRAGRVRGSLHGIPILVKDNIETADRLPTTAGSLALKDNRNGRDAPLIAAVRAAGAIILGKTNLSEWANLRSTHSVSGWSAIGGLVRNPYALDRSACGSSSGSGASVSAGLAAAAIGTETDGSITCPSSMNGIVGFKPTVGLISRSFIVPVSHSQDTPGPMARNVRDAAVLTTVMAGTDPNDPATQVADAKRQDYAAHLNADSLRGKRIGVMRFAAGFLPDVDDGFDRALAVLRQAGAELIEIESYPQKDEMKRNERIVLSTELKANMNQYLRSTNAKVAARTLEDLIRFNHANADVEMPLFRQERFDDAQATEGLDDPVYKQALEASRALAGRQGIDRMLEDNRLDALVAPTTGPAFMIDLATGDHSSSGGGGSLAAVAGYPHITVPMGFSKGLPFGLSFMGPAWSDARILSFGLAYEQRSKMRRLPTFARSIDGFDIVGQALSPQPD